MTLTQYTWPNYVFSCFESYLIRIDVSTKSEGSNTRTSGTDLTMRIIYTDPEQDSSTGPHKPKDHSHLWVVCEDEECSKLNYKKYFKSKLYICEHCGKPLRMISSDRIDLLIDSGTWEPMDEDMFSLDPIGWDWDGQEELEKTREELNQEARERLLKLKIRGSSYYLYEDLIDELRDELREELRKRKEAGDWAEIDKEVEEWLEREKKKAREKEKESERPGLYIVDIAIDTALNKAEELRKRRKKEEKIDWANKEQEKLRETQGLSYIFYDIDIDTVLKKVRKELRDEIFEEPKIEQEEWEEKWIEELLELEKELEKLRKREKELELEKELENLLEKEKRVAFDVDFGWAWREEWLEIEQEEWIEREIEQAEEQLREEGEPEEIEQAEWLEREKEKEERLEKMRKRKEELAKELEELRKRKEELKEEIKITKITNLHDFLDWDGDCEREENEALITQTLELICDDSQIIEELLEYPPEEIFEEPEIEQEEWEAEWVEEPLELEIAKEEEMPKIFEELEIEEEEWLESSIVEDIMKQIREKLLKSSIDENMLTQRLEEALESSIDENIMPKLESSIDENITPEEEQKRKEEEQKRKEEEQKRKEEEAQKRKEEKEERIEEELRKLKKELEKKTEKEIEAMIEKVVEKIKKMDERVIEKMLNKFQKNGLISFIYKGAIDREEEELRKLKKGIKKEIEELIKRRQNIENKIEVIKEEENRLDSIIKAQEKELREERVDCTIEERENLQTEIEELLKQKEEQEKEIEKLRKPKEEIEKEIEKLRKLKEEIEKEIKELAKVKRAHLFNLTNRAVECRWIAKLLEIIRGDSQEQIIKELLEYLREEEEDRTMQKIFEELELFCFQEFLTESRQEYPKESAKMVDEVDLDGIGTFVKDMEGCKEERELILQLLKPPEVELDEEEDVPYTTQVDSYRKDTGLLEAIQTGIGQLNGIPVAIAVMDSHFIAGSMGTVVGEKITRLIEYANKEFLPLIIVCASGGARMQEGSLSLMQMGKISSALYDYRINKKLFYISILTSPTTGGVTASFGMLGDIVISEPDAYIAFAGKRVIEQTLNIEVTEGVQESEYLFEQGAFDLLVPRNPLKSVLSELLQFHNFLPLNPNS